MSQIITQSFPSTRKRRNRYNNSIRKLVSETVLTCDDLVFPVFVCSGNKKRVAVPSMPDIFRFSIDELLKECEQLLNLGIKAIAPFPNVEDKYKSEFAEYAFYENGLLPKAILEIKKRFPEIIIFADVALDPYTTHGQDGIIDQDGYILNDTTVKTLIKQSLCLANAGADFVAPSDMMDGRIKAIREELERNAFINTGIMSYSAKYASSYYGPFRDAVGSSANLGKSGKENYQMDPGNSNEALYEIAMDIQEGADIVMVKPASVYLDIIYRAKEQFCFPLSAYQVSGEYAMLKAAFKQGWLNEEKIIWETMMCIKRAGADFIFSYFAKDCARLIKNKS